MMFALAESFSKCNYSVLVAADKKWQSRYQFDFFSVNAPKLIRPLVKKLRITLKRPQPDLTICDSWKSVAAVPNQSGKLIVLAHGQEYLSPSSRRKKAIRNALNRADLVVASSAMTADLVLRISPTVPVEVIYPTYMVSRAMQEPRKYRHPQETTVIVSLCRIEKRKGLLQSAKALIKLYKEGFRFTWKIAGSGPDLAELKAFVHASDIAKACQFLGRVSDGDKEDLLANADLFLMPSYQEGKSLEGFGISYIEAAKYGVPSIAGEVGGAPEAVLNGITGWCLDGSNSDTIAEALRDALSDPVKLERYSVAALQRFNSDLAADVSFEKLRLLSQSDVNSKDTA